MFYYIPHGDGIEFLNSKFFSKISVWKRCTDSRKIQCLLNVIYGIL